MATRRYTGMSQGYVVYPGSKGYMDLSNAKIAARLVANKEGYARVYSVDKDKDVYKYTKKLDNPSLPKGKFCAKCQKGFKTVKGLAVHLRSKSHLHPNPSVPKGKFIKCKAVKFNRNGSVSIKK
jgi:hypothetical protein